MHKTDTFVSQRHPDIMSFSAGVTPRRLAQPHGSYFNAVLSPNITLTRKNGGRFHSASGGIQPVKLSETGTTGGRLQEIRRLNANYAFTANDEIFDVRAGECLVSSHAESGFSPHGRGFVFSSLNGYTSTDKDITDPREALYNSDIKFVGLCQSDFVSANTALQEQGLAVQASGVKTILNDCGATIHMGDRLMLDVPDSIPDKQRSGIPNEKVRFVLRPVPEDFMTKTLADRVVSAVAALNAENAIEIDAETLREVIPYVLAAYRKQARLVVAQAVSSARANHQVDVKLVPPSFV